jgi:surface antigen
MTLKACSRPGWMIAVLALAMPVMAGNYDFLKDTPIAYFTKEDHRLFNEALDNVLDKDMDGDSRAWSNARTGAGGKITAVKTFDQAGATCRSLLIANQAKGLTSSGEYNFCRQASGKWTLAN